MSSLSIFDIDLSGLDRISKVNAYYMRDQEMDINNSSSITRSLKKLGYYEIDTKVEEETYVKGSILNLIKLTGYSGIVDTGLTDVICKITSSFNFAQFKKDLTHRVKRSLELNVCITDTDTYNFYSLLSLGELHILGY
jgi:hypothetical protein